MTILEFVCLREGFTPAELGLPDSVRDGAGNQPLAGISDRIQPPLYSAVFSGTTPYRSDLYYIRKANGRTRVKGATA
jgi:hypothetical protein